MVKQYGIEKYNNMNKFLWLESLSRLNLQSKSHCQRFFETIGDPETKHFW